MQSSNCALGITAMQRIERSEATFPRLRRASRGHKLISVYQDPNIPCSNYESQRFTWVIIFCFLLNFLASALDSVTAFVFPNMKVSKHEERIDDTQDHLPTITKHVLISYSAFPKALAASFWRAYDQCRDNSPAICHNPSWEHFFTNGAKSIDEWYNMRASKVRGLRVKATLEWIMRPGMKKKINLHRTAAITISLVLQLPLVFLCIITASGIVLAKCLACKARSWLLTPQGLQGRAGAGKATKRHSLRKRRCLQPELESLTPHRRRKSVLSTTASFLSLNEAR